VAPHIIDSRSGLPPMASPGGSRLFAVCFACHLASSLHVVAPCGCVFFDPTSRDFLLKSESKHAGRTICFLPVKDEVGRVADSRERTQSRARKGRYRKMTQLRSIQLLGHRQNDAGPAACRNSSSTASQVGTCGIIVNAVGRAKKRAREPGAGASLRE